MVCPEEVMNDKRRPVAEDARSFAWMRGELLASKQSVEDEARIRERSRLDRRRDDRASIRCIGRPKLRVQDVLEIASAMIGR